MSFLFPLIYFILANGLLVSISKKSFGKCIPITMMTNAFVYFISQMIFRTFKVGFIINIIFAISFIVIIFNMKLKNKDFSILKENFFSKGFYVFIVAYIVIYIFDFGRSLTGWDEFVVWGESVKEMFRLDKFYSVSASSLMVAKEYPPIMQLLELFFCHLSFGFEDAYLMRCFRLFCFSLFIPAIDLKKGFSIKDNIIKTVFIMGIVFLSILLFDQHGIINGLYVDFAMAMVTAYLLSYVIFSKNLLSNFNLLALSIGFSFLIYVKQIALVLYLMPLFLYFIILIFRYKNKIIKVNKSKKIITMFKVLILLVVVPLLFWKIWGFYIEKLNVKTTFSISDIKLEQLPSIINGTGGKAYQRQTASNYINAIKTWNLTSSDMIKLSYLQAFVIVITLLYLLYNRYRDREKYFRKNELFSLAITLAIGLVGYAFVMLAAYVFKFDAYEGPQLASFDRYIPTYILICVLVLVMLYIFVDSKANNSLKNIIIVFAILFIIQSPSRMIYCFPKISKKPVNDYKYHAEFINKKTKDDSKVFLIAQNTNGKYQYSVKYYINPRVTNTMYFNLPVEGINSEKYFNKKVNDYMLDYDYLYLVSVDDKFIDEYSFLFPDKDIKNTNLYKIKNDNGKVKLSKV